MPLADTYINVPSAFGNISIQPRDEYVLTDAGTLESVTRTVTNKDGETKTFTLWITLPEVTPSNG